MSNRFVCARSQELLPVLPVPFWSDGALDVAGFEAVCHDVLGREADGALPFGLASEFQNLTDDERREPSARFLNAVDIPVVVQHGPVQTGTALDGATLRALCTRHTNLAVAKAQSLCAGRFISDPVGGTPAIEALVGYEGRHLPEALASGAVGVQPGCSFVEVYVTQWCAHLEGRTYHLGALHRRVLLFPSSWMQQVELIIQVEKTTLMRRGIVGDDHCRAPSWRIYTQEPTLIDVLLTEVVPVLPVLAVRPAGPAGPGNARMADPEHGEDRTLESGADARRDQGG